MNPQEQLIERLYSCFGRLDYRGIAACYDANVVYSDPVFPDLHGPQVAAMWHMLCERSKDLQVSYDRITADEHTGTAEWIARYRFSKTGRPVENHIHSVFEFHNGKIVRQRDSFAIWKWARMALGLKGVGLGWLPPVQAAIRKEAMQGLDAFMQSHTE